MLKLPFTWLLLSLFLSITAIRVYLALQELVGLFLLEKGSVTVKSPASCQAAQHSFYVRYEQGETAFQHCVSWSWVNSVVPAVFTHGKLIGCWHWAALCALTAFLFNAINRISQVVTVPAERNGFHLGCSVGRVLNAFSLAA